MSIYAAKWLYLSFVTWYLDGVSMVSIILIAVAPETLVVGTTF